MSYYTPPGRYSSYGQTDDVPIADGDTYWTGFKSRYQPTYLQQGEAYFLGNMRLDRGTAKVRAGIKNLSSDITLSNPVLICGSTTLALSKTITSATNTGTTTAHITATAHGYSTADRINIRGANEAAYNGDFTITKIDADHFDYTMGSVPASPATGSMFANKGPRVFNSYSSSIVCGSGDYADSTTNTEGIIVATNARAYLYRYNTATAIITYPGTETVTAGGPCCIMQYLNQVYLFRGYSVSAVADPAITSITLAATTATVTTTANHGLSSNAWVTILGATSVAAPTNGYTGIYQITVTGVNTFTYTTVAGLTSPAAGTMTYRVVQPPLVWDQNVATLAFAVVTTGYNTNGAPIINMPAVDWGVNFTSRVVLPWSRDQLIMSDVLSATNYDPSQTQFRILPGTNDWIVGAFPYQQARLLVLYRKSVHNILLDGTLSIAASYEITRNFGCVARRSVANCGPYIVWLSDIGVVKMEVNAELSLQNNQTPLSDPINDQIQSINWAYASNAVATFWNNRYYLAVPTGTSTVNDTILVYNFLNSQWESVDTFNCGFDVLNFHIISYNGVKRVFAVSSTGFVSLMEENDVDQYGTPGGTLANYAILGQLKTRNYLAATHDIKRVRRFQLEANLTSADSFTTQYVLTNPDYTPTAATYTAATTTDVLVRKTVNRRGASGRLEINTSVGRPEFTACLIEADVNSRQTINQT